MINEGKFKARAKQGELGFTNGGSEQVAVYFEFSDPQAAGGAGITWYGYFTEKTEARTLESLMYAGWDGGHIGELNGLGSTEVELDIVHDEYNGEVKAKVNWVNRGGGVSLKNKMGDAEKARFAQRMKARAASVKRDMASRGEDPASFSFGANDMDDLPPGL